MSDIILKSKAETIDVEVLPPEGKGRGAGAGNPPEAEALPRLIALVMDSLFKIPGIEWRFGLNPFFDLLPVLGDGAVAVVSALTLFVAARYRVPKVVMARMGLNILLNAAIGMIPGVGEVFAFVYRPSLRNYRLLQKHLSDEGLKRHAPTHGDWLFVGTLIGGVIAVFAVTVVVGAWLFYGMWRVIFHALGF
ncbi:MAG TPA: DUF4112 domain-containing protein [Chthoniobacteraceae bacterium]|nr:DUF4112 domain-containing protein [Chthoniobacteraceae bacterium]